MRLYQSIGAVVGLSSILACGGGKSDYREAPYNPQRVQTQNQQGQLSGSQLEKILKTFYTRLTKKEIPVSDYERIVIEDVRAITLRDVDGRQYAQAIEYLWNKQPLKKVEGLNQAYLILPSTPLSEEARKDIGAYQKAVNEIVVLLSTAKGGKPLSREIIEELVEAHLKSKYPNMPYDKIFKLKLAADLELRKRMFMDSKSK